MRLSHVTCVVAKLSGYKAGAQLQLVKDLSAEAVGLGVAGDRSAACFKLDHGVVIRSLIVDDPLGAVSRDHPLADQRALAVVNVEDGIYQSLSGDDLVRAKGNVAFRSTGDLTVLVRISILFSSQHVNRTDDVALTVIDVLVVGCQGIFSIEPLFAGHLSGAVIGDSHLIAVGIGNALQSAIAGLVGILHQLLRFTVNADRLQVVVSVVSQHILHAVTPDDLRQIVKGIVGIRYMSKLRAVSRLAGHPGGSARVVILVGGLVAAAVCYLLVTGGVLVYGIAGSVASRVGLHDQIIACVAGVVRVGIVHKAAVDRAELTFGKGGLGQGVTKSILCFLKDRRGIVDGNALVFSIVFPIAVTGAFHYEIRGREVQLQRVTNQLDIIEVNCAAVVAVITAHIDIPDRAVLALSKLDGGKLPILSAGGEVRSKGLGAVLSVGSIIVTDYRTQPEGRSICTLTVMVRQSITPRPTGQSKGLTGRTVGTNSHTLRRVTDRVKAAGHHERSAHIEACSCRVGRTVSAPAGVTLEVAVLQHIICVGIGVVFQLCSVGIDGSLAVQQDLYLYALGCSKHKGRAQTDIFRVGLTDTLTLCQHSALCGSHTDVRTGGSSTAEGR